MPRTRCAPRSSPPHVCAHGGPRAACNLTCEYCLCCHALPTTMVAVRDAHSSERLVRAGENSRESSRINPNARSEVSYEITFQKQGEDTIYPTAALLQPKDRKQDGRANDYVQQRHEMGSFGSAILSFERSNVPLSFKRQAEQKDGTKTKLLVHVKQAD